MFSQFLIAGIVIKIRFHSYFLFYNTLGAFADNHIKEKIETQIKKSAYFFGYY